MRRQEPTLEQKVSFLRLSASYPQTTRRVEAVETHMSWIFLTDDHAYKLKKPVHYPFLDFSTVEARHQDCREEVRLNRRLAPEVYLGTVPLGFTAGGKIQLEDGTKPVDWLVKMRRLPADRMLDQLIRAGTLQRNEVHEAALRLAKFYRACPAVDISGADNRKHFEREVRESRRELLEPSHGVSVSLVETLAKDLLAFLDCESEVLDDRVRDHRIVEGHGDLRPEHICLTAEPAVIDCLEFNRAFRIVDPVDELCFLSMECEFLGAPQVGPWFLDVYGEVSGDHPSPRLQAFYKGYRAFLRARLSIWHLADPDVQTPSKWRSKTQQYLALATNYAGRMATATVSDKDDAGGTEAL